MVAVYLVVFVATIALNGRHVRPLFEGFQPPPQYQWVNPPPEFQAGNVKPTPKDTDLPFGSNATIAVTATSSDSQFLVNLPEGAVDPRPGDTAVLAHISPLDPATLGPLPETSGPNGNAYRLELTYRPSRQTLTDLAKAGSLFLTVPSAATGLYFSPDGHTWQLLKSQQAAGPTSLAATVVRTGYYLGVTSRTSTPSKKGSGTARIAGVVALTVALAAALVNGPALIRRARKPKPSRRPPRR